MKNGEGTEQPDPSRSRAGEGLELVGESDGRWRLLSLVLASGAFVVGSDSFVIAGLLPNVATTLDVPTGRAGSLVTVFSMVYACCALPLAVSGGRVPRRCFLSLALVVVAAGSLWTATGDSLVDVILARTCTAIGAAAYTAGATSTAAAVAGERERGQAVAIVLLGMTAALVLGSPLGTAIAAVSHWRMTFVLIAVAAGLVAVLIYLSLQKSVACQAMDLVGAGRMLSDPRIIAGLFRTLLIFSGVYLVYTYLSTIVTFEAGASSTMTILLTAFGVFACLGASVAGRLVTDLRRGRIVLNCCTTVLIMSFVGLLVGHSHPFAATALVGVFGAASFGSNPTLQTELITYASAQRSHIATALFQTVLYLGAAAGAGLGTVLVPLGGSVIVLSTATLLVLCSLIPSLLTTPIVCRGQRRLAHGPADAAG